MKRRAQPLCTHSCSFKNSACRSVHTDRQEVHPLFCVGWRDFLTFLDGGCCSRLWKQNDCFKRVINVAVFVRLVGKLWNNDSIVSDPTECRLALSHICTFWRSQLLLGGGGNLNKPVSSKQTDVLRRYECWKEHDCAWGIQKHSSCELLYSFKYTVLFITMISITGWYMKSRGNNLVRYRSNINQVNDFQALDLCLFDSTYHRDRWVARLRRKCEDCCCSNRTTRGWGHD